MAYNRRRKWNHLKVNDTSSNPGFFRVVARIDWRGLCCPSPLLVLAPAFQTESDIAWELFSFSADRPVANGAGTFVPSGATVILTMLYVSHAQYAKSCWYEPSPPRITETESMVYGSIIRSAPFLTWSGVLWWINTTSDLTTLLSTKTVFVCDCHSWLHTKTGKRETDCSYLHGTLGAVNCVTAAGLLDK